MRRSSRIQTKQQGNAADQKSERTQPTKLPRAPRLPVKTMKVLSPKRNTCQKTSLQHKPSKLVPRKRAKNDGPSQNRANRNRGKTPAQSTSTSSSEPKPENVKEEPKSEKPQKSNEKVTTSGKPVKAELSIPLLIQEDSDDSILSDVANSLKIDRTIKNLSPRKFFHNKDPKTTRSGRSFSPYDFASYSALFGAICANQSKTKSETRGGGSAANKENRLLTNKHNKRKRARRDRRERSKQTKRPRKKNAKARKMVIRPPEELKELKEVGSGTVGTNQLFVPAQHRELAERTDDIFSEKVPESFWLDFPYARSPNVEDHCLPTDFWETGIGQSTPVAEWEEDKNWYGPKKLNPDEMAALSKVSLSDADKYDFKSAFKDLLSQITNFEDSCGEWKPSLAYGKFDVMEAESGEGKRFYRKRITDTGLIAWHKYNLVSSTKYCSETDVPTTRPVIKVRSNQCPKADLVWRLNQTQPPPSIEDVLNGVVVTHPDQKSLQKMIVCH